MQVIRAHNINDAWDQARLMLNANHIVRPSRVGEVWEHPEPVTTMYERPRERVLFNAERNMNPFFAFMESLWMLAGRRDVAFLERFNSKIADFVGRGDAEGNLHDAYGHRIRFAFDMDGGAEDGYADQFAKVIRMMKKSPDERRSVICMWNPVWDLERPDQPSVPCNTNFYVKIRDGKLTITVCCRSNDICLGAYSANNVQFSVFQEYLAAMIGVEVGEYWQISDSWHAYTSRWEVMGGLNPYPSPDPYLPVLNRAIPPIADRGILPTVKPYPLVKDPSSFDEELLHWMDRDWDTETPPQFDNPFFNDVAEVLWQSWAAYKIRNDIKGAIELADLCEASDWSLACQMWLNRIEGKRRAKKEGAVAV